MPEAAISEELSVNKEKNYIEEVKEDQEDNVEEINENLDHIEEVKEDLVDKKQVKKVSFRTVAYTAAVTFVIFFSITTNSFLIGQSSQIDIANAIGSNYINAARANQWISILTVSGPITLSIIVAPVIRRRKVRYWINLAFNVIVGFILISYILSDILWLSLAPTILAIFLLPALLTQIVVALVLLICLIVQMWVRWRKHHKEEPDINHPATGTNQMYLFVSQVFLVVGSGLLVGLQDSLNLNEESNVINKSTPERSSTSFILIICLLLVVLMRHYARSHGAWLTGQAACRRMEQFFKEYLLSDLERELLNKKKFTTKIIEGIFTINIYPRNNCLVLV